MSEYPNGQIVMAQVVTPEGEGWAVEVRVWIEEDDGEVDLDFSFLTGKDEDGLTADSHVMVPLDAIEAAISDLKAERRRTA